MDSTEFEAALTIDKHDLDTELVSQADLFYRVAQQYAEAASRKDQAYENLKRVDADLNLQLREEFEVAKKKTTEASLSAHALIDPAHSTAFKEWLTAKEQADKAGHLKEAFIQRSYMLRDLAQLYIAGYYSEKSVSADDTTSKEAVYKKRKNRLSERRQHKHHMSV